MDETLSTKHVVVFSMSPFYQHAYTYGERHIHTHDLIRWSTYNRSVRAPARAHTHAHISSNIYLDVIVRIHCARFNWVLLLFVDPHTLSLSLQTAYSFLSPIHSRHLSIGDLRWWTKCRFLPHIHSVVVCFFLYVRVCTVDMRMCLLKRLLIFAPTLISHKI